METLTNYHELKQSAQVFRMAKKRTELTDDAFVSDILYRGLSRHIEKTKIDELRLACGPKKWAIVQNNTTIFSNWENPKLKKIADTLLSLVTTIAQEQLEFDTVEIFRGRNVKTFTASESTRMQVILERESRIGWNYNGVQVHTNNGCEPDGTPWTLANDTDIRIDCPIPEIKIHGEKWAALHNAKTIDLLRDNQDILNLQYRKVQAKIPEPAKEFAKIARKY